MPAVGRTGLDPWALFLLRAARETGMLDALTDSAATPAEVAREADVTERAARVTVDALAELGFLQQVDGNYEVTNRGLGFLAKTDPRSIGRVPHALDVLDDWVALPETMRSGTPPARPDDWSVNRLGAVAATPEAEVRACVTAAIRANPGAERVLDLQGAPGTYAKEFVRRGREVTLVDEGGALSVAERFLAREPVDCVGCDSFEELPHGFDLAFGRDVATALGPDDLCDLLRSVRDVLSAGGAVVLLEAVGGRSAHATGAAAEALATTERGGIRDESAYLDRLATAGFDEARVETVPGVDHRAVVGRGIE